MKRLASVAVATFTAVAVGSVSGVTLATFTDSAANSGTSVQTKKVFPGVRTLAAYSIRDYSNGGAERDNSNEFLAADGIVDVTGTWPTAFSAIRYLSFQTSSHLAGGLATSGVDFNVRGATASGTLCFYVETRLVSTGAVLASHGTAAAPLACTSSATLADLTVPLPEVTSTDVANDLEMRIYAQSTTGDTATVDVATVTGSTPYGTFTLPPAQYVDAAGAVAVTAPWSLAVADGTVYRNDGRWDTAFSASRYIDFDVDSDVPASAVITSATLTHSVKDFNSNTVCWYVETWTTALLATHGSAASPYCNTGSAYGTEVISLPEVDTPAEANALTIRVFAYVTTAARDTVHDVLTVGINYHVD
jgi:hypothetical protein